MVDNGLCDVGASTVAYIWWCVVERVHIIAFLFSLFTSLSLEQLEGLVHNLKKRKKISLMIYDWL